MAIMYDQDGCRSQILTASDPHPWVGINGRQRKVIFCSRGAPNQVKAYANNLGPVWTSYVVAEKLALAITSCFLLFAIIDCLCLSCYSNCTRGFL